MSAPLIAIIAGFAIACFCIAIYRWKDDNDWKKKEFEKEG